ncbi:UNVERIFIED_CONTAM: hypothetical protein Scaly_3071800 [Sesamum calycinum]|uniref:Uncharacterized protein n=1 Tax=Sesamum calycinum TaxID=2727403 RepID=A0AAW2JU40_9LAMI
MPPFRQGKAMMNAASQPRPISLELRGNGNCGSTSALARGLHLGATLWVSDADPVVLCVLSFPTKVMPIQRVWPDAVTSGVEGAASYLTEAGLEQVRTEGVSTANDVRIEKLEDKLGLLAQSIAMHAATADAKIQMASLGDGNSELGLRNEMHSLRDRFQSVIDGLKEDIGVLKKAVASTPSGDGPNQDALANPRIVSWDDLKREMRKSCSTRMRHGRVEKLCIDWVRAFEVGLQEWARKELQKRNLQDLASAIRVAEGFLPYGEGVAWMIKERLLLPRQSNRENLLRRTQDASSAGPHRARDCPKKEKLSALIAGDEQAEPSRVNPLQLLNAIRHEKKSSVNGLMYVDVVVNG